MSRTILFASVVVLTNLVGCDSSPSGASDPPAEVTVRRAFPGTVTLAPIEPDADIGPIAFDFEGARGYIRATMKILNGEPGASPFIHDALFLAKVEGRLSIAIRKPWPGHERGRVTIRCEGGGEDSSIEYEPELWYGNSRMTPVTIETADGAEPAHVKEGTELDLARIVAGPSSTGGKTIVPGPLTVDFQVTFGAEPIKPRVKAGVRPPR